MKKKKSLIFCPYCQHGIDEKWHQHYGLQKLEKGWIEAGIPIVGRVKIRRQTLVMVYFCSKANLPFVVTLPSARRSEKEAPDFIG